MRKLTGYFITVYLTVHAVLTIAGYLFAFDLSRRNVPVFDKYSAIVLMFDSFVIEYTIIVLLISTLLFCYQRRSKYIVGLLAMFYVLINTIQMISVMISGEFLSELALSNLEFIPILMTSENIALAIGSVFVFMVFPFFVSKIMERKVDLHMKRPFLAVSVIGLLFYSSQYWVPDHLSSIRKELLQQNHLESMGTIVASMKVVWWRNQQVYSSSWSHGELKELKRYGFTLNESLAYPLMKDKIYHDKSPFLLDAKSKPNVIIIFTEGLSARTSGVYSEKYAKLTPNLIDFSQDSIVVENYYSHTAATYRGLLGQMCSFYPKYGGVKVWQDNQDSFPMPKYQCITDIFHHHGYESTYLNTHFKDVAGNDEMMDHLGFDTVLNAEDLLSTYLNNEKKLRNMGLTDHQLYRALIELLKARRGVDGKPLLLVTYSYGTHAWLNIVKDGIAYGGGKSNTLNTVHNMDHAFGEFWKFFKNSEYSENTVLIFTADHSHYHEKSYVKLMERYNETDYQKLFIDRIPLIIRMPSTLTTSELKRYDANYSTSIDFAPSLIHLLGFPNEKNTFIGGSIFDKHRKEYKGVGISSIGKSDYLVDHKHTHELSTSSKYAPHLITKYIRYVQQLEAEDRVSWRDESAP